MVAIPLRSSVSIVEIEAAHDSSDGNYPVGASIPLPTDHVIALVSTVLNEDNAVVLPANAPVGVSVEVHSLSGNGFQIQAASGDDIRGASQFSLPDHGVVFRKITATRWSLAG